MSHEEACKEYAALVHAAGWDYLAPNWTSDLIEGGWDPGHLRAMASRWRAWDLGPIDFADRVELLATAVEALRVEGLV